MIKKIKFDIKDETDLLVIGITTALKDYKLAFHINKSLNINLKKTKDFCFSTNSKENNYYSLYQYNNTNDPLYINLLENRNPNGVILPNLKQVDFFMMVRNNIPDETLQNLVRSVKGIKNVIVVFMIKPAADKMLPVLLSELELHLLGIPK